MTQLQNWPGQRRRCRRSRRSVAHLIQKKNERGHQGKLSKLDSINSISLSAICDLPFHMKIEFLARSWTIDTDAVGSRGHCRRLHHFNSNILMMNILPYICGQQMDIFILINVCHGTFGKALRRKHAAQTLQHHQRYNKSSTAIGGV